MNFLLGKYRNTLFNRDERVESNYINLTYKDGTIHTMVAYRVNVNGVWLFGFPYRGNEWIISRQRFKELYADPDIFLNNCVYYQGSNALTGGYYVTDNPTYCVYNSERKLGIYFIPIAGGTNYNIFSAIRNEGNYATNVEISLASVGILTDSDFWDNVESGADGRVPWQEDNSTTGGGKGTWDDNSSDNIELPDIGDLNARSINNTQFMSLYKLTSAELSKLGNALWSTNFFTQLSNSALRPMDFIISLQLLPVDASGTVKNVKAGPWLLADFGQEAVTGTAVSNQFIRVDCGSIEIKEKWGSAIDYQTEIQLYLPFIGIVTLSPQDVMASTISVVYTVDLVTGNCLATVKVNRGTLNSVLYHFNGSCSANYPVTSADWSSMFASIMQTATGIAGAVDKASGVSSMPDYTRRQRMAKESAERSLTSDIEGTAMGACNNLIAGNFAPSVTRAGNMSANVGFMDIKKPYLIISRLVQSLPKDFGHNVGYMSNVTMKLSDCKGFTQVRFIHLDGIVATSTEINELDSLLKQGIVIK